MKTLMLGNQAIAQGLYEAGCAVISSYPGTPSTEITEYASKFDEMHSEWAPNEKVALEVAIGSSIAGKRAFCAMKHVGLNVAADPLYTASYTGVTGGLVIAVADDPGMHSSQNEQDSRHHAIASKVPMLEPSDSAECLEFTKLAFELSEKFDTPVIIRLSTRIAHSQSLLDVGNRVEPTVTPYKKNVAKYVMMPAMAKGRHIVVEERTIDLTRYAEIASVNRIIWGDTKIGIITSGAAFQYAKEALGETASFLKLGLVNPLPLDLIRNFASKVDTLYVIEELDDIFETHCKKIGLKVIGKEIFPLLGELSQNIVRDKMGLAFSSGKQLDEALPIRPPVMCAGCPHRGIFYLLSKLGVMVSGDIGCYTLGALAPLWAMDSTICMGASISGLHGFNKALPEYEKKAVAVIGDSTFIHSGITGLINVAYNASNSTVIILDNSITGMTGHQQNPTTGYNIKGDPASKINLEELCKAVGINRVTVIDPNDLATSEKVIKAELAVNEPSVIIARRPCALLKIVVKKPALVVNKDKCVGCKMCMKIGCPAISMVDSKAVIDKTLCIGCDLCTQMCKSNCIMEVK